MNSLDYKLHLPDEVFLGLNKLPRRMEIQTSALILDDCAPSTVFMVCLIIYHILEVSLVFPFCSLHTLPRQVLGMVY